ncbi:hypothetical protein [Rhizobium sp. Leaf383]|uniref:hypothetical protein n=1 Tax=Rhizobium sp. Leaf383 TaxID=1736357 RepID=UPI00071560BD|nr:hypothetical protein [Rhizobium sp. Leaf383]KQS84265.1 hypothetical protein ASG58_21075 [Rhizobium sp. Leaf383]
MTYLATYLSTLTSDEKAEVEAALMDRVFGEGVRAITKLGSFKRFRNRKKMDMNGDSRTAMAGVSAAGIGVRHVGLSDLHCVNWANCMTGHRTRINRLFALSGYRSDQYIKAFQAERRASNAGISLWGFPLVNDLAHAQGAQLTGSITGDVMTVTAVAGLANVGAILSGTGITAGTKIVSQISGTTGGVGTYRVSVAQSVASTTIASVGYTDLIQGVYVDLTNVDQVAYANLSAEWQQDLDDGKVVVLFAETGATNLTAAAVQALLRFNGRQRVWAEEKSVTLFDFTKAVWLSTASPTQIQFKPNMTLPGDVTHFSAFGAYTMAMAGLADWMRGLHVARPLGATGLADQRPNNPRQNIQNNFFTTAAGGSAGANMTVTSGTVPANMAISASGGAVSSTIALMDQDAGDTQSGKKARLTLTNGATPALVRIAFDSPPTSYWTVNDLLEAGMHVDIEANNGGSRFYITNQVNTNLGTKDCWGGYGLLSQGNWPAVAPLSLDFKTEVETTLPGSTTVGYAALILYVSMPANAVTTFVISNPYAYRLFDAPAF